MWEKENVYVSERECVWERLKNVCERWKKCVREIKRVCVREKESVCEWYSECVCEQKRVCVSEIQERVCVRERKREWERGRECVCERKSVRMWAKERVRVRERECAWESADPRLVVLIFDFLVFVQKILPVSWDRVKRECVCERVSMCMCGRECVGVCVWESMCKCRALWACSTSSCPTYNFLGVYWKTSRGGTGSQLETYNYRQLEHIFVWVERGESASTCVG